MSTIAVRRGFALLLATVLATMACYTVLARSARASVRPAQRPGTTATTNEDASHRPVIADAVKYVRNADGSVTRTR
jgi:hypothetical protein